jgi:archaellum component FlaC
MFYVSIGANTNNSIDIANTTNRIKSIFLVNSPNVSSDERIKKEITNLTHGLDFVKSVNAKQYKLSLENADDKYRFGYIAQDVKQYLQNKGLDCCNHTFLSECEENGYLSLQYEQAIPILHNAINELDNKINTIQPNQSEHLIPLYETGCNLGSSTLRWDNIYYNNLISPSDRNLKDNIQYNPLGLEFLKSFDPVIYTWKQNSHGRNHSGYIAQDVEASLSKFGYEMKDWALIGKVNGEYHLKYLEFIPIIHNAVLELNNKLDAMGLERDIKNDLVKLEDVKRRDSDYNDCLEAINRKVEILEDNYPSLVSDVNDVLQEYKTEIECLRNENDTLKAQMLEMQNELNEFKAIKEELKALLKPKTEQPPQQPVPPKTTNGRLTIRQSNLTPNSTIKSDGAIKVKSSLFGSSKK